MNGGDKMNREDFPMLNKDIIYFDNGATTFKPKCVIEEISNYYENLSVNSHRGDYDLSLKVDELYEETRDVVKNFIHAKKREEVIFTKGTTEGMNMIVFGIAILFFVYCQHNRPFEHCGERIAQFCCEFNELFIC